MRWDCSGPHLWGKIDLSGDLELSRQPRFGTNGYYGQGFGFLSGAHVSVPRLHPERLWNLDQFGHRSLLPPGTDSARLTDNPNNTQTGRRDQGVVAWSMGLSSRECSALYRARSFSSSPSIGVCFRRTEEEDDDVTSPTHKVRHLPANIAALHMIVIYPERQSFLAGMKRPLRPPSIRSALFNCHPEKSLRSTLRDLAHDL